MSSQDWFDFWEGVTILSGSVVLRGLWLEYDWSISTFLKWLRERRKLREYHVKVESPRERKGGALVVLGITFELVSTGGVVVQSHRIETQHREQIAQLETALAWRSLNVACANAVIPDLSQFAKQEASVQSEAEDIESVFFSFDIQALLNAARWNVPQPLATYDNPSVSVGVLVTFGTDNKSSSAGLALYQKLKGCGVLVYKGNPDASLNGKVAIRVNHRLPPDAFARIKP